MEFEVPVERLNAVFPQAPEAVAPAAAVVEQAFRAIQRAGKSRSKKPG
jgi:hypothetical protein